MIKGFINISVGILISSIMVCAGRGMENWNSAQDLPDLPNEMILFVCGAVPKENLQFQPFKYLNNQSNLRNTLALVCRAWHDKAIELTDTISCPTSLSFLLSPEGEDCQMSIPAAFTNLTRLNLNNNISISPAVADIILRLQLKAFSSTFSNTLKDSLVSQMTTLEILKLDSNVQISDQAFFSLTGLKRLTLCEQKKVTSASLYHLTNVTRLHLRGIYCITTPHLLQLKTLETIALKGDYTWVEDDEALKNPAEVGIFGQPTISLDDLTVLPRLNHLTLEGVIVTSRQALAPFKGRLGDKTFTREVGL